MAPTATQGLESPSVALGDLGDFDDVDALLAAVASGVPGEIEATDATVAPNEDGVRGFECVDLEFADEGIDVLLATATVDGEPVAVFTLTDGDTVVFDLVSCTVVARDAP